MRIYLANPVDQNFADRFRKLHDQKLKEQTQQTVEFAIRSVVQHTKMQHMLIKRLEADMKSGNATSALTLMDANTRGVKTSLKSLAKSFTIPGDILKPIFKRNIDKMEIEKYQVQMMLNICQTHMTVPTTSKLLHWSMACSTSKLMTQKYCIRRWDGTAL